LYKLTVSTLYVDEAMDKLNSETTRRKKTEQQISMSAPITSVQCTPTSAQAVRHQPLVTAKSRQRTTLTLSSTRRYEAATCQTSMLTFRNKN